MNIGHMFMIKAIISDLSGVLLFHHDKNRNEKLNERYKEIKNNESFDFWQHFRLNNQLLSFYSEMQGERDVYIFTSGFIQEDPELKKRFEGVFKNIYSSAESKIKKTNPESYIYLSNEINLQPEEIVYIDDDKLNCDAAKKAGLSVIKYTIDEDTIEEFNRIILND